ncbi:hypothetical protein L207DRAFT_578590 [Hyaloscypha variabilis F]|uniref:2EXR domain-containing protein n=1 Tax=Hyaloscypha variabilis (strain UAMH 11265 / GT02V1 / F) TaxID=1149755 RepID=A0A2J6S4J1_HYAVF|nr:hypothetical protein L207DRAFT_578590 [Hyaloscypha variabilis F]
MDSTTSNSGALDSPATAASLPVAPAAPAAPAPLVDFKIFPNLPQEIQDEIWRKSLPGPRLITIAERLAGVLAVVSISQHNTNIHALRNLLRALVQPPMALQVTRKSRAVALLHYQPMYGNVLSAPVYIDTNKDILHFYNHRALSAFDRICRATYANIIENPLIRAVAIPHRHLTTTPVNSLHVTMNVIKTWHRVKEIYMVSPAENGPINGFGVGEMKMWLTLHRRLVLDVMMGRQQSTWTALSVFFLREEDLEEMFG